MSNVIAYMEGTDPLWLTTLQLWGYGTLPVSNGVDGHGRNIQMINERRKPDLVLCYLHKLAPVAGTDLLIGEMLHRTKVYEIPVLCVCPRELMDKANETKPADTPPNVEFVDPADVLNRIREILG